MASVGFEGVVLLVFDSFDFPFVFKISSKISSSVNRMDAFFGTLTFS